MFKAVKVGAATGALYQHFADLAGNKDLVMSLS
jgi:hypothetical protein